MNQRFYILRLSQRIRKLVLRLSLRSVIVVETSPPSLLTKVLATRKPGARQSSASPLRSGAIRAPAPFGRQGGGARGAGWWNRRASAVAAPCRVANRPAAPRPARCILELPCLSYSDQKTRNGGDLHARGTCGRTPVIQDHHPIAAPAKKKGPPAVRTTPSSPISSVNAGPPMEPEIGQRPHVGYDPTVSQMFVNRKIALQLNRSRGTLATSGCGVRSRAS